jgi:hypothetical protein
MSNDESLNTMIGWLNNCNLLRKLDFNPDYYIKYNLKSSKRIGCLPIGTNKLKEENLELYNLLLSS